MDETAAKTRGESARGARKWLVRLGVSLLSFAGSLAVVEWYLQDRWPVGKCVLGLDDELLFRTIPGSAHVQFMSEHVSGEKVVVRINEDGFRGPAVDKERKQPRWMVFGDSFVMAENEPFERTFPSRLAHYWNGEREVISAGVTGYGPDQTLLLMEELLPKFQPDGVVLVICSYNDLGDPVRNHLMHIGDQGQLVRRRATMSAKEAEWFEKNYAEAQKPGLVRLWNTYKRLDRLGVPARPDQTLIADYLRAHKEDYSAHVKHGELVAHGILRDIYDADVAIRPEWPSAQYKVKLMGLILGEMQTLFAEADIPLYLVIVPGGLDLDPSSWLRIDETRYPTYRRDRLCNTFGEIGEQAGIPTLNLYPEFASRVETEDLYVGALDAHWNAQGMDLGARLCSEFIATHAP